MATKLAAIENNDPPVKARAKAKRSPPRIAVTFALQNAAGEHLDPRDYKLTVKEVYRDLQKFADAITDDPANVPLFAKIEVPFL